ncbi:MAG: hypothetical protein ACK51V_00125, partial [bacterium]
MPRFIVEAAASDGRRIEQLQFEARDGDDAARQARAQGRYPVRVRVAGVQWHAELLQAVRPAARLSLADLALFA